MLKSVAMGALLAAIAGAAAGLAVPGRIDFRSPLQHWPGAFQTFLPLLGAGGSGAAGCTGVCKVNETINSVSGVNPMTITIPAPANGNTLILCFDFGSSRTLSSITTANVTWTTIFSGTTTGSGTGPTKLGMAFGNVSASAGTTVSIQLSGASFGNISVTEWTGLLASPLDGTGATSTGTSTTPNTSAYTTGTANDLVFALLAQDATTNPSGFPAGYAQLMAPTGGGGATGIWPSYLLPAPSGAQSASWTLSGSTKFATGIIGFKP